MNITKIRFWRVPMRINGIYFIGNFIKGYKKPDSRGFNKFLKSKKWYG